MNNSSDNHQPTPEFRAQLKRDISRAVRNEQRFGSPAAPVEPRRLAMGFAIAAGVVLTLATGMVLGASVSYASAEMVDSPRPALAILPIGNAINALRCAPAPVEQPATRTAKATAAEPARQSIPVVDSSALTSTPPPPRSPDRARIAALATEHQGAVVRGDTAAEYIVMVLDAAEKYVWSTIGSGNLSIEVGGDPRTPSERSAYNREHQAEFWGATGRGGRRGLGATLPIRHRGDSLLDGFFAGAKAAARGVGGGSSRGAARGGGAGGDTAVILDSLRLRLRASGARGGGDGSLAIATLEKRLDSLAGHRFRLEKKVLPELLHKGGGTSADSLYAAFGRGVTTSGGGARGGGSGTANTAGDVPGTYSNGWSGTRNGPLFNLASGLEERSPGQSGIQGLLSASVRSAETYFFPAGELASVELKVMVVHLTPGTVWKGP